jgi:NNP family nitrate/nitrite transporter-like MFS transporter
MTGTLKRSLWVCGSILDGGFFSMSSVSAKGPERSGSALTVLASFLHFDTCFTIWVILGSLSVFISADLHLNPAQQGLMVAIPALSGSLMRFPIGLLSDRYSSKGVGVGLLVFLFLPLLLGWLIPVDFSGLLGLGLMLGVAGASFAVALPLASRWYPPERQGLVMGIAAAGNIGTVIANLLAPRIARTYGWHAVLGLTMIPLAVVLVVFLILAKDSPTKPKSIPVSRYMAALGKADMWWFCLLYGVTFGGFVGLSNFMAQYFHNQYQFTAIAAGSLAATAAFVGSTIRPLGGYLADKLGGVRTLTVIFAFIFATYALASLLLPMNLTAPVFIICMAFLGLGNGAVFQLVPQCFRSEIGVATGVVGAFGGLGGFLLPILMGSIKQVFGSYAAGWVVLAVIAVIALIVLRALVALRDGWRTSWAVTRDIEKVEVVEAVPVSIEGVES